MSRTTTVKSGSGHLNSAVILGQLLVFTLLVCFSVQSTFAATRPGQPEQELIDQDLYDGVIIVVEGAGWTLGEYTYDHVTMGGHLVLGESHESGTLSVQDGRTFTFGDDLGNLFGGNVELTNDGGAIYVYDGRYTFEAVYGHSGGSGVLRFKNNETKRSGGAIFITDKINPTPAERTELTFLGTSNGNYGYYPADSNLDPITGAHVNTNPTTSIYFEGNKASGTGINANNKGGGAIYNERATITFDNVRFGDGNLLNTNAASRRINANIASRSGGAIYNDNGVLTFHAGVNHLPGGWGGTNNGGSIDSSSGTGFSVSAPTSHNLFNGNIAEHENGGAIYSAGGTLTFDSSSTIVMSNIDLTVTNADNVSRPNMARGVMITSTTDAGLFHYNEASELSGGAIYNDRGTLSFAANSAITPGATPTATANTGAHLVDSRIHNIVNATANGGVFRYNLANDYGGAIYHNPNANALTFTATAGAAIANAAANATAQGAAGEGVADATVDVTTSANGGIFEQNRSGRDGGAFFNNGGVVNFTASAVNASANANATSNSGANVAEPAVARAQAIASTNANASAFDGNTTTERGGAIFNAKPQNSTVGGILNFTANAAAATANATSVATSQPPNPGAGEAYSYATAVAKAYASGGDFVHNTAKLGGAIYNEQGTLNVTATATVDVNNTAGANITMTPTSGARGSALTESRALAVARAYGITFTENEADLGGAIYNENGILNFTTEPAVRTATTATVTGRTPNGTSGENVPYPSPNADIISDDTGSEIFVGRDYAGNMSEWYGHAMSVVDTAAGMFVRNFANDTTGSDLMTGHGGAIYNADGGTVNFTGISKFYVNIADNYGGAIYNAEGGKINFTANASGYSSFVGNGAVWGTSDVQSHYGNGGINLNPAWGNVDVWLQSNVIKHTAGTNFAGRGATGLIGADGFIWTTNPWDDIARWGGIMDDFDDNEPNSTTTKRGGAIYNAAGGIVTVTGSTVPGPYQRYGYFLKNHATELGGAIFNSEHAALHLTNVDFYQNAAGQFGGAIYNDNGDMSLGGGTFALNFANQAGGAVYFNTTLPAAGESRKKLTLNGNTYDFLFENNRAGQYGGAIYNTRYSDIDITSIDFIHNAAAIQGGAIWNAGIGTITGSEFSQNTDVVSNQTTSEGLGGAIYNVKEDNDSMSGELALNNNIFDQNNVNASPSDLSKGRGGAIYNDGGNIGTVTTRDFDGNGVIDENDIRTSGGNVFTLNRAYEGGAIYNNNGTIELSGGHFTSNTAVSGGAIYSNQGTVRLDGVNFSTNRAFNSGAETNGGAIYLNDAVLELTDTNFTGNVAETGVGGAIYSNASDISINVTEGSTATFENNVRAYTGVWGTYNYESIYFDGANTLNVNVAAGGNLNMYDPMSWGNGAEVDITKTGEGQWLLAGESEFDASTNTGTINVAINEGTLYLNSRRFNQGTPGAANMVPAAAKMNLGSGNFTMTANATLIVDGASLINTSLTPPLTAPPAVTDVDASSITTTGAINLQANSKLVFNNVSELDYARSNGELLNPDAVLTLNGNTVTVGSSVTVNFVTTQGQDVDFGTPNIDELDWFAYFRSGGKLLLFEPTVSGTDPVYNKVDHVEWDQYGTTQVWTDERRDGAVNTLEVENGFLQLGDAQFRVLNNLQWTGKTSSVWDTDTDNWYENDGLVYSYTFWTNDAVIFDDTYTDDQGATQTVVAKTISLDTDLTGIQTGGVDVEGSDYVFNIGAGQTLSAVVDPLNGNAGAGSMNFGSATVNLQGTGSTLDAERDIIFGKVNDTATITMESDSVIHAGRNIVIDGDVTFGVVGNGISSGTKITAEEQIQFNTDSTNSYVFDLTGAQAPVGSTSNAILTLEGEIAGAAKAGNGTIDIYNIPPPDSATGDPISPIVLIETEAGGVTDTGTLLVNGVETPPTRGTGGLMTGLGLNNSQDRDQATQLLLLTVDADGKASDLYWRGSTTATGESWNEDAANWTGTVNGIRVRTFLDGEDDVFFADDANGETVNERTVRPTMNVTFNTMTVDVNDPNNVYTFDLTAGSITALDTIDFGNGSTIISQEGTTMTANGAGGINFGTDTDFVFDIDSTDPDAVILTINGAVNGEKVGSGEIYITNIQTSRLGDGEHIVLADIINTDTTEDTAANGKLIFGTGDAAVEYTVPERGAGETMYALDTAVTDAGNKQLWLVAMAGETKTTLHWTGVNDGTANVNSNWSANNANTNWTGNVEAVHVTTFLHNDEVVFDNTASNKIVNLAEDVTVSTMTVSGSDYKFNLENGGIFATDNIDLDNATVIVFLEEDDDPATTDTFVMTNTIESQGTIRLQGTTIEVNAEEINAEVFRDGKNIEVMYAANGFIGSGAIEDVVMETGDPLLVGTFYQEGNRGYVRLGLYDFFDAAYDFHHNTTEAIAALNVLRYAKWGDDQWGNIMGNTNRAIHQLRGTELVADALGAAMWSPWEITHRRMRTTRDDSGWNTWGEGYYRTGHVSSDDNAMSYDFSRGGTMIGADFGANRYWHIGGAFGYGLPGVENEFGKIDGDDLTVGMYSKINFFDTAAVTTFFGYGYQSYEMERHDFAGTHKGDFNGDALYASVEFAKPIQSQWGVILPLIALDHQTAWTKKFNETGNSTWNQAVSGASMERTMVRFGVDGKWQSAGSVALMSRLQAGFLLDGDEYATVQTHFPGSMASMSLRGSEIGALQVNAGISATGEYRQRYNWFFDLDGYLTGRSYAVQGQFGLSTRW